MTTSLTAPLTVLALLAWGCVAIALTRRAEAPLFGAPLPRPWVSGACVAALAALAVMSRPAASAALCGTACIALVAAAATDVRTGYLLDAITLPAAVLVGVLVLFTNSTSGAAAGVGLIVACFGGLVAYSRGRWMGLGDVKAMYALGAAFGPIESLIAIFAACVSGIVTTTLLRRLAPQKEVRFGPHLAAGAAFALVAGDALAQRLIGTS
jgi:prepilin signal peptidase PulO-like enzyme (type II secretory pathway)